ncbi:hypothetical protein OQA88_8135 [Cercophora sp. LCS_1]
MAKKKKGSAPGPQGKNPAACIIPNLLYLGPVSATSNAEFLKREGITHVLSIGKSPAARHEEITYERISLTDEEDSPITEAVKSASDIIDKIASAGGKVLVHCSAAISRSPAVVAGYLMAKRGMTLRESLETLVQARDVVSPNPGFLKQLGELEKEIFDGASSFDPAGVASSTRLSAYLKT